MHLITQTDETRPEQQNGFLNQVQQNSLAYGVNFTWEYDTQGTTHARHIITDNGWKISIDRGLDIFQRFEMNDASNMNNRLQKTCSCKAFGGNLFKSLIKYKMI